MQSAEPGLFRIADEYAGDIRACVPAVCRDAISFMLQTEVSTVYKESGETRKIHHVICAPGFEQADFIADRLTAFGNLAMRPTQRRRGVTQWERNPTEVASQKSPVEMDISTLR